VTDANGNLETDADGNTIPFALPPHGITHHYAPLAVISAVTSDKDGNNFVAHDCRSQFDNVVEAEQEQGQPDTEPNP